MFYILPDFLGGNLFLNVICVLLAPNMIVATQHALKLRGMINSQCTNLQLGGAYCVKAITRFTRYYTYRHDIDAYSDADNVRRTCLGPTVQHTPPLFRGITARQSTLRLKSHSLIFCDGIPR